MESSGKENKVVEKDVMGEAADTSSHDADFNTVKTTRTENDSNDIKSSEMNAHVMTERSSCSTESQKCQENVLNKKKEINDNTVATVTNNTNVDNNVETMVTDDILDSRKIAKELNIKVVTEASDTEKNRKPVNLDTNNKNLDTTLEPKAVNEKDLNPLKLICNYGSDSDDNNEEDCIVVAEMPLNPISVSNKSVINPCPSITQDYRKPEAVASSESEEETDSSEEEEEEEESSSSSTASSSSSSDESDNSSESECAVIKGKKENSEFPKTKGELGLEDLPPIEDLHISVSESESVEIGKVLSIVDSLVVVQSIKGLPALDLDSILFLDKGQSALGQIFDVFGKVGEACYCVRFNSKDHALEKGIKIGMPVYYAPRTEHSKFVFVTDLLKIKGSDASWVHNNEPPLRHLDFSDDEQEKRAFKKPFTRNVERDETQPQNKRFHRRVPNHDEMENEQTPHGNPDCSWKTPFNRYRCPSPSLTPPRPGSHPLIRPPSFRTSGPPPAHFYNAAAGAPAVTPHLSPWAVSPPATREDINYNMNLANIPHPQSQVAQSRMRPGGFNMGVGNFSQPPPQPQIGQNQMRPGGFNMGVGSFGQSPPPPPPSPASHNHLLPTTIPGSTPFLTSFTNAPRPNTPSPFTSLPPFHFGSSGQNGSFSSSNSVFMNYNVPPPRPPQGW